MFQTSIWRPTPFGETPDNPLNRPLDYISQRQQLAKTQGRTHFKLASNAMASSNSSSFASASASASSYNNATWSSTASSSSSSSTSSPQQHDSSASSQQHQHRRGRSRSIRHLWAYSPERAYLEVEEEEQWYAENRRIYAEVQMKKQLEEQQHQYAALSTQQLLQHHAKEIIPIDAPDGQWADYREPSASATATTSTSYSPASSSGSFSGSSASSVASASSDRHDAASSPSLSPVKAIAPSGARFNQPTARYEPPPESTSLLPILARPPADLTLATQLERAAYGADENLEDEDQLSYLHPPAKVSANGGGGDDRRVLYTRSQLPTLDLGSRHLWHALHDFRAVTSDYASGYATATKAAPHPVSTDDVDAAAQQQCPFLQSQSQAAQDAVSVIRRIFNWSALTLPASLEQTWYGVLFRSVRKEGSESINLYEDDRLSHEEAVSSGGLVLYWYGRPDAVTGENVATCIWTSRADAIKASRLPMHARAARHAQAAYEKFELARYKVVKTAGETTLCAEAWQD